MNNHYRKLFRKITAEVKEYQQHKDYKKFKKIDTHEHVGNNPDFDRFLHIMDEFNIKKVFLMPTGQKAYQKKKQEIALEMQRQYPDKFVAFGYLDRVGSESEDYLKKIIGKGIKGLKLLFWHPDIYPQKKIAMDSKPIFRIFDICQKSNIPVLAHMSIRNFSEHREQLANTLNKFPDLLFLVPHYLGAAPQLNIVGEMLDRYPNLHTDVSMGGGKNRYVSYIQGFHKEFKDFFKKYRRRLCWGADLFIDKSISTKFYRERMRHDINMFSEEFYYSPSHKESDFLYGLDIPDNILEDVFYNNAKRIFRMSS